MSLDHDDQMEATRKLEKRIRRLEIQVKFLIRVNQVQTTAQNNSQYNLKEAYEEAENEAATEEINCWTGLPGPTCGN